jgi:crotonobetaine/carnitine-CoA ligase
MSLTQLTDQITDTPARWAQDDTLQVPARILHWARVAPLRPFLTEVGGRAVTYGEFVAELQQWCTWLDRLGLQRGECVASLMPLSIDSYLLWLAASLNGLREVSINRELRGEFLHHPLRNSASRYCFVRPEDAGLLAANGISAVVPMVVARDHSPVAGLPGKAIGALPTPADVACIVYTSGSTGPARGAIIRWAQIAAIIGRTPREWLSAADVMYAPWPMFHITGRSPIVAMVDVGGQVILREKLSVSDFWADIRTYGCTSSTIGTAVPLLLNMPAQADDQDNPLVCAYGNTSGAINLVFQARFGVRLMTCYGSTEIGFPVVNRNLNEDNVGYAGYPRPGYQLRVIDADGRTLDADEPGELLVRAGVPEMLMGGYLNDPEATAAVLRDGWYHTGDRVRLMADGAVQFVDRMKDTIRRYGENISSTALETDLLKLDVVQECAVFGIDAAASGKEIVLVVRHRDGCHADPQTLYTQLLPLYPKYMLPSYIRLVDSFPKTPNGKIQKPQLRQETVLSQCWQTPVADAGRGQAHTPPE